MQRPRCWSQGFLGRSQAPLRVCMVLERSINISTVDVTRLDEVEAVAQPIEKRIREFKLRYRPLCKPTVEETVEGELEA